MNAFGVGRFVIVRTFSAGVHCGVLRARDGCAVVLDQARRIWSWSGANTLHEAANGGVEKGSKISDQVDEILLPEAIEIIPCTAAGEASLRGRKWAT